MNFFKVFIASVLGVFAALILSFLFFFAIALSSSDGTEKAYVRDNSYLTIPIKGNLVYRTVSNPLDELIADSPSTKMSVNTLTATLEAAAKDDRIKGIWLEVSGNVGSWVHYQEARDQILAFKESGKWIIASTDDIGFTEAGYYLASAADSVFSPAQSLFEFDGMSIQGMFYKGSLEKIGVEPIIVRSGKYKSAVEPYIRNNFSENNREQLMPIVQIRAQEWVRALAEKSGKSIQEVNELLNSAPSLSTNFALQHGFIDELAYKDQIKARIHQKLGLKEDNTRNQISFNKYLTTVEPRFNGNDKIAVLYTSGNITPVATSPFEEQTVITGTATIKEINTIRKRSDIKAVVVYIDSPGGAATTSDIIWRELKRLDEEKAVYIYMGSIAASGGYYMAMAGRFIMAHPQTITGSIGVYGQFFNAKELLNDKLGVTTDAINSHEHADWLSLTRPLSEAERNGFGNYVDHTYEAFLSRVAENRNWSTEQVHELAQGRVWTGVDAYNNGLVDSLGSLRDLIQYAAQDQQLQDFGIESFPKEKTLTELLFNQTTSAAKAFLSFSSPIETQTKQWFAELKRRNGQVMMRLPFDLIED